MKKQYEIIKPNYQNCILNVIAGIKHNFGCNAKDLIHPILKEYLSKKTYDNVIMILLDGLGSVVLDNNLSNNSYLKIHKKADLVSIYPSTTGCAAVATMSGLAPIETGWTGWQNYIRELNRNVILLTGKDYYEKNDHLVNIKKDYLPYEEFFNEFNVYKDVVFPIYGKNPSKTFDEFLEKIQTINNEHQKSYVYGYWDEPDETIHEKGCKSNESKNLIETMDEKIKAWVKTLKPNTLVIITADHGHIDVEPIHLIEDQILNSYLERKPSNDSRCLTFKVKKEKQDLFVKYFNTQYGKYFKLYESKDFIKQGFLGSPTLPKSERIEDFLADYVAVAISDKFFNYSQDPKAKELFLPKSHHAGMTKEEMLIPLIIIESK